MPFTFSNETLPTWLGSIVVLELLGTKLPFPSDKHGSPTRQLTCCLLIYNPIVCLARLTQPQMERDILSLTGHVDGGFRPYAPSLLNLVGFSISNCIGSKNHPTQRCIYKIYATRMSPRSSYLPTNQTDRADQGVSQKDCPA